MKQNKNGCDLKSCTLCNGCLKDWLPAVAAARKTFDFKKGEKLFNEGDAVAGVYFLVTGKVKIHKQWGADKELIVRIAGEGDIAGHRGLGKEMIYPVSATALEATTACFITLDFFTATLKVNHDFTINLLFFYTQELQESEKNMRNLAHMQVKGRMAYGLLKLKNRFGITDEGMLQIQLSKQDLSSYAGTSYETAFRILNEFIAEKIIEISGKQIKLNNEKDLMKYTTENKTDMQNF